MKLYCPPSRHFFNCVGSFRPALLNEYVAFLNDSFSAIDSSLVMPASSLSRQYEITFDGHNFEPNVSSLL